MDENLKKPIMIVIIVVCLGLAGAITFFRGRDSGPNLKGKIQYCKCANCGATSEMDAQDFRDQLRAYIKSNPEISDLPALVCDKCGQRSVFKAIKCKKCDNFFFKGEAGASDYSDRCTKCKFSPTEERTRR